MFTLDLAGTFDEADGRTGTVTCFSTDFESSSPPARYGRTVMSISPLDSPPVLASPL